MSTAAVSAKGTTLQLQVSSTYTTIVEQVKITGPAYKMTPIDVTSHDSTGYFKEIIAGKKDAGTVSFEGNYIPGASTTIQAEVRAALIGGTLGLWKLIRPDTGTETEAFSAYVTGFEVDHDYSKQMTVKGTLEITGQTTISGS